MKIVFICGSLEPGHDGVGDYTRMLAVELIRQGHEVAAVALNDSGITEQFLGNQLSGSICLPVLRLPSVWDDGIRFQHAKEWIEEYNPELLSLQFVIFSFHIKGLPFKLYKRLAGLGKGRNWHIMFHELWVGISPQSPLKLILWGWLQQGMIKLVIRSLDPKVVHTQSIFYQRKLKELGFRSKHLPLFGNIPVTRKEFKCRKNYIEHHEADLILVMFGAIHPEAPIELFTEEVADYSKRHKTNVLLKIVGKSGAGKERWAAIWRAAGLKVELVGEQLPERISEILLEASLGISTTPLELVEKSGAVAAMREHGLTVLCVRQPWEGVDVEFSKLPEGVVQYSAGTFKDCISRISKAEVSSNLEQVALKLIDDLSIILKQE